MFLELFKFSISVFFYNINVKKIIFVNTLELMQVRYFPLKTNRQRQGVYFLLMMAAKVIYYCFQVEMRNDQTWPFDFVLMYDKNNIEIDNKQRPFHVMYPNIKLKHFYFLSF